MRAVLGIDAAWTLTQPSGVALVAEQEGRWRLLSAASSYAGFVGTDDGIGRFDAAALTDRSSAIAGAAVTLVAADIPLARSPIISRRTSDNLVSAAYGAPARLHTQSVGDPPWHGQYRAAAWLRADRLRAQDRGPSPAWTHRGLPSSCPD